MFILLRSLVVQTMPLRRFKEDTCRKSCWRFRHEKQQLSRTMDATCSGLLSGRIWHCSNKPSFLWFFVGPVRRTMYPDPGKEGHDCQPGGGRLLPHSGGWLAWPSSRPFAPAPRLQLPQEVCFGRPPSTLSATIAHRAPIQAHSSFRSNPDWCLLATRNLLWTRDRRFWRLRFLRAYLSSAIPDQSPLSLPQCLLRESMQASHVYIWINERPSDTSRRW